MSRRIYRCKERYRDRHGRLLFRCPNVHSIDRGVFVTFELHLDVSPVTSTLPELLEHVRERVRAIVVSVLNGLRNRDNIYLVALFQMGSGHNHVHMYIDQSRQMINTNGAYFDLFARNTENPVLKSVWNLKGLLRYLMQEGSLVVYTHNETLLNVDDETDAPTTIATRAVAKGKENMRQVIKNILDKNPRMDLKSLNQYCLRNHFSVFDQTKVQIAFQNWVSKRVFESQKKDVTDQDPFVTLAVLTWIACQTARKIWLNVSLILQIINIQLTITYMTFLQKIVIGTGFHRMIVCG